MNKSLSWDGQGNGAISSSMFAPDQDDWNMLSGLGMDANPGNMGNPAAFTGISNPSTFSQNGGNLSSMMLNKAAPDGFGLNLKTMNMAGNVFGGVGSLAKAWASLKNVKAAENELAENKRQYDQNYAAQRTTINNRLSDQNAWKSAQGRSDMAKLVT